MNSMPTITKNLLIINILCFLAGWVLEMRGFDLNGMFGLHFFMAEHFGLYQFLSYMFMHGGFEHLFFNMFALWMFGCVVEREWGPRKFLLYYMTCGIGAGIVQEITQFFSFWMTVSGQFEGLSLSEVLQIGRNSAVALNSWNTVGASGAIYGILLAFGMLWPNNKIFIFPLPIPIKAKFFVIGYVVIELVLAMSTRGDGVAHMAHLGGMLFGFLLIRYWNRNPRVSYGNDTFEFFRNFKSSRTRNNSNVGKGSGKTSEASSSSYHNPDWEYNAQKKKKETEIDVILDKIRKSGYSSLTEEEKKKLFNGKN